jgi:2-polyprenyl-3-methyl-5-hydroxy-6-metoxy-1,4-benzoquinol methylase
MLYKGLIDRWLGSPGRWSFEICSECDLAFLNPPPTTDQLSRAYADYFTHQTPTVTNTSNKARKWEPWILTRIKKTYRFALKPVERRRAEMNAMYTSHLAPGSLLDVGCGNGLFLKQMRDMGWQAQGVEPDARSAKIASDCYGFKIYIGTLHDAGFPYNCFDCITLSHVIEHLRNPILVLSECLRILKPGGMLVITTPNFRSFGHFLLRKRWLGLDPPRHLLLFSSKSLELAAHKAGFLHVQTHTSEVRADMIFSDIIRIQTNRPQGNLKKGWYLLSQLFLLAELAANSLGLNAGEDLVLRAQK